MLNFQGRGSTFRRPRFTIYAIVLCFDLELNMGH